MSQTQTKGVLSEQEVIHIFELMGLLTEAQRDKFLFKQLADEEPSQTINICYDTQDVSKISRLDQPEEDANAKLE